MHKYGERETTRSMMASLRHVTTTSGLRKFKADGYLFDGVYMQLKSVTQFICSRISSFWLWSLVETNKCFEGSN